ncbi:hypothetical protein K2X30_13095 [bacterium]|nr:hypothetical protein [bacterium]
MKAPGYGPKLNAEAAKLGFTPRHITAFDSSTALLRALGRFLRGKDFPALGIAAAMEPLALAMNWLLPESASERIYKWGGKVEAIPPEALQYVRAETIATWMIHRYPRRRYPAIMIGSSNGAAMHLCAALGIPWLPQTFLILVRHKAISPDDPERAIEAAKSPAKLLLNANPELQLHHMLDPNQDRLMSQEALYFRMKRLCLGKTYEDYLRTCLEPGGTIFLLESGPLWPTTKMSERHFFQEGGLGALDPWEYVQGSSRVKEFLARHKSQRKCWSPPKPDGMRPEAEWGFEPALREDVKAFAQEHGYQVRRIIFDQPEDLSPLVADLYRTWYQKRGIKTQRLIAESFFLVEPWWMLRTGSVPYWLSFNTEASAHSIEQYLDRVPPYNEIHIMLFSNGVDTIGLTPIEHWRSILHRARNLGEFMGVNPRRYPRDFATFIRYHTAFKKFGERFPMPKPISSSELGRFVAESEKRYKVQWQDLPKARAA